MKINQLLLKNFRKYTSFQMDLNEELSVIVGNNGSGKTALLDALAIALGTYTQQFRVGYGVSIKKTDARLLGHLMDGIIDVQPKFPVEISARGKLHERTVTWSRKLNSETGSTTIKEATQLIHFAHTDKLAMSDGILSPLPLISYYGTGRLWAQKKEKKESSTTQSFTRDMGYMDCLSVASNSKLMLKWFEKMTLQSLQHKKSSHSFLAVQLALTEYFSRTMKGTDCSIEFNFDTHDIDFSYQSADCVATRISMSFLSDGYKNTLSMIADIAYRMAVLNPWLESEVLTKTSGVVLIDEVDLHLHPLWQETILQDLQNIFPSIQFIVTTHAPAVIASCKRENLFILENETATNPSIEVFGSTANGILTSVMGANERQSEIKELFADVYHAIDSERFDHAATALDTIESKIGNHDPELTSARITLDLEQL